MTGLDRLDQPTTQPPAPYRLTDEAGTAPDPVLVEIVEGYLASVELEVETAIGRTSRSPMIRDAHDYRAGIHDRHLRKLTGRSYSALVHPVVRDFPLETMREGDLYWYNDCYGSHGAKSCQPCRRRTSRRCSKIPYSDHESTEGRRDTPAVFIEDSHHGTGSSHVRLCRSTFGRLFR